MKKRITLALFTSIVVLVALSLVAATKPLTTEDAVAAIPQFESDTVKADLAGDQSILREELGRELERRFQRWNLDDEAIDVGCYERHRQQ
jgi:hypothetical protein